MEDTHRSIFSSADAICSYVDGFDYENDDKWKSEKEMKEIKEQPPRFAKFRFFVLGDLSKRHFDVFYQLRACSVSVAASGVFFDAQKTKPARKLSGDVGGCQNSCATIFL